MSCRFESAAMVSWLLLLALVFLQGAQVLQAVRVLPAPEPDITSNVNAEATHVSVIIIGAGMSGLDYLISSYVLLHTIVFLKRII